MYSLGSFSVGLRSMLAPEAKWQQVFPRQLSPNPNEKPVWKHIPIQRLHKVAGQMNQWNAKYDDRGVSSDWLENTV